MSQDLLLNLLLPEAHDPSVVRGLKPGRLELSGHSRVLVWVLGLGAQSLQSSL